MPDAPFILDFVAPSRIIFGWGRRREVGAAARSLGKRAFVVCGSRTLESSGQLQQIVAALTEAGVKPVTLASVTREPLVADVDACVDRLRGHHAGAGDLLLAVGGGSGIDLAKAAAALVAQRDFVTTGDYLEGVGRGLKVIEPPLPLLAIPTTGGTGTEATRNAVISSVDPPYKKSLRSELMVPRIVLIDPELAVSVPPHITAWTGLDALTQLIESFMSRRATPATQSIVWLGLQGAIEALREAYRDGHSRSAREKLAQAALYSGIALANSGLGMAHGVAAALGVHCGVPHGLACAVMLPIALKTNLEDTDARRSFSRIAAAIFGMPPPDEAKNSKARIAAALEKIRQLLEELRIPRRLSEIGVLRGQIPDLVRDARGNSMSGNPRTLSDEKLTLILDEHL
ncbi:MAG: iron-containing alcohol dehydrogenase [Planctomycetales bacterium]